MQTMTEAFDRKVREITALSMAVNDNDTGTILAMMQDHCDEIADRFAAGDDHWAVETADLIVLCYELLCASGKDVDAVFEKALPRFDAKLRKLLMERHLVPP